IIIAFRELVGHAPLTKLRAGAFLAMLFAACTGYFSYAFIFYVATKVHGVGILLTENDTLVLARARSNGRLVSARVKRGDQVRRGDVIGEIYQADLVDAIREGEMTLARLKHEDRELTQIEDRDRVNQGATIPRSEHTALKATDDSRARSQSSEAKAE